MRTLLTLLTAALIWASPAAAQTTRAAQAAPAPDSGGGRSFIWTVERDGRVGWLVGSLHLLSADFYPLPAAMESAFARADTLVEEIDMNEADDPELLQFVLSKGTYPDGRTLADEVSADTHAKLRSWLEGAGMVMAPFERMKPWMIAMTLQTLSLQRLGFDPALGVDRYFREGSMKTGKAFIALETPAEQIAFLDGLSPATQETMLRESIETAGTDLSEIRTIADAWRNGDADTVEEFAVGALAGAPEVYAALLVDRNRRWMPTIESCMQTRRCFVVVGAAHLVGAEGLVELLREKGYTVSQQ